MGTRSSTSSRMLVVQLGQDLGQQLRRQLRDQLLAVLGRQEAHQVGDVGRVQGFQQLAQALGRRRASAASTTFATKAAVRA